MDVNVEPLLLVLLPEEVVQGGDVLILTGVGCVRGDKSMRGKRKEGTGRKRTSPENTHDEDGVLVDQVDRLLRVNDVFALTAVPELALHFEVCSGKRRLVHRKDKKEQPSWPRERRRVIRGRLKPRRRSPLKI